MNAHQRRKCIRKNKELVAAYRAMQRLTGQDPIARMTWVKATDFQLASRYADGMRWWLAHWPK